MPWFTSEEEQVLIKYFIEIAEHGFPDTKQYLREHVNTLLRAKTGDPTFSVGINWVDHWLGHNKDHLQKYWNTSLDNICAKALNPTTTADYSEQKTDFQKVKFCLWVKLRPREQS